MRYIASTIGALGCLAATGCTTMTEPPAIEETADNCPIIESSSWTASISPVPGGAGKSQLAVSGKVTMPTPGYTFAWEAGRLDRSAVPSFELKLLTNAPDGMVAQVLDTREVSYQGPAATPRYRSITITCDGRILGRIDNVQ